MKINRYNSKKELADVFTDWLVDYITSSKDQVHIALSGGSTPKMIFEKLAREYGQKVDWSKVQFYWGDERCVPPTDDDSNYGMTAELLLSKITMPPENINRIKGEDTPDLEAIRYAELLKTKLTSANNIPQFDLVILGMGDDGHTASIFPHEVELWGSEHNCVVAEHPETGQKRISLSGNVINNAKTVAFLISGASKSEKLREILKGEGDYCTYPAALVAPTAGELYWFLDSEAAQEL